MPHTQKQTFTLQTGHFLGLKFQEGWWFTHVLETEQDTLKPWILQNENGNRAAIAATTAGSEDQIRTSTGDRLAQPGDAEKDIIFQISIGIAPSRMQLFYLFGRERNNHLENFDSPGENAPIVNGNDSPYNSPSVESETFTVNDIDTFKIQAYNPMDISEEARVSVHINKIKYATVTDVDLMNAFLQGQVRARLRPAGRGAAREDQVRVPGWLDDAFGEHIKTTQEIFQEAEQEEEEEEEQQRSVIPQQLGGGTESG